MASAQTSRTTSDMENPENGEIEKNPKRESSIIGEMYTKNAAPSNKAIKSASKTDEIKFFIQKL